MNLIPESNGLRKVNMKRKLTPIELCKRIALILIVIFAFGFLYQTISNFIGKEKISSRLSYGRVDNKKMEFNTAGSGDYTIVFDGAIGANLYEWDELSERVEEDLDVNTFVYNRRGYGFNDGGDPRTPSEQASDLKILLRKAGVSGKLILVGEEYGSLVMTNFAEMYPEVVSAMVLVKPISEEGIKSGEYKNQIRFKYYKSKIESFGTSFGLTSLLNTLGLTYDMEDFEASLPRGADEEYSVHKTKKNYRQAISNELGNIYNYEDTSQIDGLMAGKPLYIISNEEENELTKLGDDELTKVYKTDSDKRIVSIDDEETIYTGISVVLKECRKMDKKK